MKVFKETCILKKSRARVENGQKMRLGCRSEAAAVTQHSSYEDRKERAGLRCIKEVNIQRTCE